MTTAAQLVQYAVQAAEKARSEARISEHPGETKFSKSAAKWASVSTALTAAARLQAGQECEICRGKGTVPGPRCDSFTNRDCIGPFPDENWPADGSASSHRHAIPCPNPVHA